MTNNKKYSTEEGFEILKEVLMRMSYSTTKTLSENFDSISISNYKKSNYRNPFKILNEQEVAPNFEKEKESYTKRIGTVKLEDEFYSKPGFKVIKTPGNQAIYVPKDTDVLSIAQGGLNGFTKNFVNWLDPQHGGKGNTTTQNWMNADWNTLIPAKSVWSFKTPDGTVYKAQIQNSDLNNITDWDKFYQMKPEPDKWMFYGYFDKNMKPYDSPPVPVKPWYLSFWEFIKENWDFIAYLVISTVVTVLTGGMSTAIQAISMLVVDIAFIIPQLREGDYFGASVIFIISLVPFISTLSKFGKKAPLEFIKKYGQELSEVKTVEQFDKFVTKLTPEESELMARVLKQTPEQLKKITTEGTAKMMSEAVKTGNIFLPSIPLKDRLWVKNLYEMALMGGIAVSLEAGKFIYDIKQFEKEWNDKGLNSENTVPKPTTKTNTQNKTNQSTTDTTKTIRGLSAEQTNEFEEMCKKYNIPRNENKNDSTGVQIK
jgi:hypothetical protein